LKRNWFYFFNFRLKLCVNSVIVSKNIHFFIKPIFEGKNIHNILHASKEYEYVIMFFEASSHLDVAIFNVCLQP